MVDEIEGMSSRRDEPASAPDREPVLPQAVPLIVDITDLSSCGIEEDFPALDGAEEGKEALTLARRLSDTKLRPSP
jgi:hypothetical protein